MRTHESAASPTPLVPPALAESLTLLAPATAERVASLVRRDVPALDDLRLERRRRRLAGAALLAVHHFLDRTQGRSPSPAPVHRLFRQVGYEEAVEGRALGPVRAALRIATRESWTTLRDLGAQHDLTAADLGRLGDALFDLAGQVEEDLRHGYAVGQQGLARDAGRARARLLDALLDGADPELVTAEAARAGWPPPAEVVVLAARFHGAVLGVDGLPPQALARTSSNPAVVVCPADVADRAVGRLRAAGPEVRVAASWSVPVTEVAAAHGWATRLLDLVDLGVVPPASVLWCRDHRTQLWLHADQALRRDLRHEMLGPLLGITPHARKVLSDTLLAWLETRASAPALAHRLGVHPQTVRYRWKRINDLFGASLHDPEFLLLATMLLRSNPPLWHVADG